MNIHQIINYKSYRKGLITDEALQYDIKRLHGIFKYCPMSKGLRCYLYPANTYGIMYPNVYGKRHSLYPKF